MRVAEFVSACLSPVRFEQNSVSTGQMGDIQGTSGGHFGDKCPTFVLDAEGTFEGQFVPWLSMAGAWPRPVVAWTWLDLA